MENQFDDILNTVIPDISKSEGTDFSHNGHLNWGNLAFWELDIRAFFDLPDKVEYKESYTKWGQCGWTIITKAPIKLFHTAPTSQTEADTIAMKYWDDDSIEALQRQLFDRYGCSEALLEATKCFRHELYRGCAMIITSIIEREMFDLQSNEKSRFIGRKAVMYTGNRMANSERVQEYNTPKCYVLNLSAFLDGLFAKTTPNFTLEGMRDNIVRDYLVHGFHDRSITKVDCLKLMNALDNWLYIKEGFGI